MSFGTVRTRYATMAPRIAETIAVTISSPRARISLLPAEAADERDELGRAAVLDPPLRSDPCDERQTLGPFRPDRDHQLAGTLELLEQRLGHFRRRGGDDDAVERRLVRPAVRAVEHLHRDVVDLQLADDLRGAQGELVDPFDREDFGAQFREYDRLVSRSRANLQHLFAAAQVEQLDHPRHDVRLRDRLSFADGERAGAVRLRGDDLRHEAVARHLAHRLQDPVIGDPARRDMAVDHERALMRELALLRRGARRSLRRRQGAPRAARAAGSMRGG